MKRFVLERFLPSEHGVFGVFTVRGFVFMSLEEEEKDNAPGESCIPEGVYVCKRTKWHSHNDMPTWEITEIPERARILFHPGNTEEDIRGCVALGMTLGPIVVRRDEEEGRRNKKLAVLQSRKAFKKFMSLVSDLDEFEIEVRWF